MNGKCIDGGNKTQGSTLQMNNCEGWSENPGNLRYGTQMFQWDFNQATISLPVTSPRLCMDNSGGNLFSGAPVGLMPCVANAVSQKWYYTQWSKLKPESLNSTLCLDVRGAQMTNGALLQLYTCHGGPNQKWGTNSIGWINHPFLFSSNTLGIAGFWGTRFTTISGGNVDGRWNDGAINSLANDVYADKIWSNAYYSDHGVGIYIESGETGLAERFSQLFTAMRNRGLQVFVTVNGNSPGNVDDSCNLMNSILSDPNNTRSINFVVPQLYRVGIPLFDGNLRVPGCAWNMWQNTTIPVVPALYSSSHRTDMDNWAAQNGIRLSGYMIWNNF